MRNSPGGSMVPSPNSFYPFAPHAVHSPPQAWGHPRNYYFDHMAPGSHHYYYEHIQNQSSIGATGLQDQPLQSSYTNWPVGPIYEPTPGANNGRSNKTFQKRRNRKSFLATQDPAERHSQHPGDNKQIDTILQRKSLAHDEVLKAPPKIKSPADAKDVRAQAHIDLDRQPLPPADHVPLAENSSMGPIRSASATAAKLIPAVPDIRLLDTKRPAVQQGDDKVPVKIRTAVTLKAGTLTTSDLPVLSSKDALSPKTVQHAMPSTTAIAGSAEVSSSSPARSSPSPVFERHSSSSPERGFPDFSPLSVTDKPEPLAGDQEIFNRRRRSSAVQVLKEHTNRRLSLSTVLPILTKTQSQTSSPQSLNPVTDDSTASKFQDAGSTLALSSLGG